MASPQTSSVRGWWLHPGRREIPVDEHHAVVLARPERFGLTASHLTRVAGTDPTLIIEATMRHGWTCASLTEADATAVELWTLDLARVRRLRTWAERHRLAGKHRITVDPLGDHSRYETTVAELPRVLCLYPLPASNGSLVVR